MVGSLLAGSTLSPNTLTIPGGQLSQGEYQGPRVARLVSARPLVREVPSSIPDDIISLFYLLSFLCSLTSFKYPENGALMERGG